MLQGRRKEECISTCGYIKRRRFMENNSNKAKENKKKSFFARLFDRLDKKMEEKAKSQPCCKPSDKGGNSCCS